MFNEFLPIGSVVILKGGIKKLMITGYKVATDNEPNHYYDYIAVFYPEGFIGSDNGMLFNHSDINDIVFKGYDNPERKEFISFLDDAYKEEQNNE